MRKVSITCLRRNCDRFNGLLVRETPGGGYVVTEPNFRYMTGHTRDFTWRLGEWFPWSSKATTMTLMS